MTVSLAKQPLTEDQIEQHVERAMNRLDRQFLSGTITQQEYDHEVMIVDKWAHQQLQVIN
jgi:hypothetical protein